MTLLDYPDKVACTVFTLGCNFRCHYCYNPEFVLPEKCAKVMNDLIPQKAIMLFLQERKHVLDGVVVCGGEPTLQHDLVDFVSNIKDLGLLVKLDTNGRDPDMLQSLINQGLVDYVSMDIKHVWDRYEEVTQAPEPKDAYIQSANILLQSDIDYEFRTTIARGLHTLEDIATIAKQVAGAKAYYLQNFEHGNGILNASFE